MKDKVNKVLVTATFAVHPIQAKIIGLLKEGKIDFEKDTLRGIAKKVGWSDSPQQIKHHLEQLLKLGALNRIRGEYAYDKIVKR